jgi:hypothetical protein
MRYAHKQKRDYQYQMNSLSDLVKGGISVSTSIQIYICISSSNKPKKQMIHISDVVKWIRSKRKSDNEVRCFFAHDEFHVIADANTDVPAAGYWRLEEES